MKKSSFFLFNFFENTHWIVISIRCFLIILFLLGLFLAAYTPWRKSVKRWTEKAPRQVLATAVGNVIHEESRAKVIKLRTQDGLFIEIYGSLDGKTFPLIDRIQLPYFKDGYFHIHGQAAKLALKDLDGDGLLEIIAPSFDNKLNGHLSIYSYNVHYKRFFPYKYTRISL